MARSPTSATQTATAGSCRRSGEASRGHDLSDRERDRWDDPPITVVQTLLERTGISYDDLIVLVKTRFLNPDGALALFSASADCDLETTTLKRQDDASLETTLSKLHRFIRLWRKLGWSIPQLDKALTALGAGDIDNALLENLARVKQLRDDLKLPLVRLRDGLFAIREETADAHDPTGELLDGSLVETAMQLVEGTLAGSGNQLMHTITDLGFDKILGSIDAARALLLPQLAVADDTDSRKQQRRGAVLAILLPYLRDRLSRGLIKQTLAEALKIDSDLAATLLENEDVLRSRVDAHAPVIADFLALAPDGLTGTYRSLTLWHSSVLQ